MYFQINGKIRGRDDFEANDDIAAVRIARVLYDTFSDVCDAFELWQGKRLITAQQAHHQSQPRRFDRGSSARGNQE
jgi:hypothetical protein